MKNETHSMTNAAETKKPPAVLKETPEQTIARLEQEKADLEYIVHSQPRLSVDDAKYMSDIDFLDGENNKSTGNKIVTKDINDHKNISLWTPWGKRVGPMHPNNAKFVYHKFRRLGRMLSVHKPSEPEIQMYYKTPEYIAWKKKHDADRAMKNASKKGAGMEKVIDAMVKITGENRKDIISIIEKPANLEIK